jgi:hypothetical protein
MDLNSVERIKEYSDLSSEKYGEYFYQFNQEVPLSKLMKQIFPQIESISAYFENSSFSSMLRRLTSSSAGGSLPQSAVKDSSSNRLGKGRGAYSKLSGNDQDDSYAGIELGDTSSFSPKKTLNTFNPLAAVGNQSQSSGWPVSGAVAFKHIFMQYSSSDKPVLKQVFSYCFLSPLLILILFSF